MGRSLHNTCNEFRIDYRQKRRFRAIQSDHRMLHHSISTQSGMAVLFQFRAISHLIVDDHWNGCLLNCLRGSHSRNNSICFTIDVAIHRLGFLCRPHQHGIPVEFDEMNETVNISESSFSFDSSMRQKKKQQGSQSDDVNPNRTWSYVLSVSGCLLLGPEQHCTKYNTHHKWHQKG